MQKGKCNSCKAKLSWQYPIVELLTGIVFVLIFQQFNNLTIFNFSNLATCYLLLTTIYYCIVFSLLLIIAVYDFRHQIIPNFWVYAFIALSFFVPVIENLKIGNLAFIGNWSADWRMIIENLGWNFSAGIAFFLFFAAFWFFSKGKAMGYGDAKLALGIGLLLGLMNGIAAIVLSFWLGALIGILLLILKGKKYTMKSKIAFGPFMIFATFLIFLWGGPIIDTVLKFLSFGSF